MLIGNIAGDRLHQILNRQQAIDAAIFIHHQRQMHALDAHLQQ